LTNRRTAAREKGGKLFIKFLLTGGEKGKKDEKKNPTTYIANVWKLQEGGSHGLNVSKTSSQPSLPTEGEKGKRKRGGKGNLLECVNKPEFLYSEKGGGKGERS